MTSATRERSLLLNGDRGIAHWSDALRQDGFAIVENALGSTRIARLIDAIDRVSKSGHTRQKQKGAYGMRHLIGRVPEVRRLAEAGSIRSLVEPILGETAFVVRSLFFDKTPGANWAVPWHQDLTIAVRHRIEAPGFGPWSVKDGALHVQAPASVLERMLTVRLHLDDCDTDNGALMVLPGSHQHGRLRRDAIRAWRAKLSPVSCVVSQGGAVLMRPLLLHSSSSASRPVHRRVIHVEFAAQPLPCGLDWAG